MSKLAHLLIASGDSAAAADLSAWLGGHGYACRQTGGGDELVALARTSRPDIVLIGPDLDGGNWCEAVNRFKSHPLLADIPVILMVSERDPAIYRAAAETQLDDIFAAPFPTEALLSRLKPVQRLATMHTELRLRATTARSFGLAASEELDKPEVKPPTLLLFSPDSGDIDRIAGLLPNAAVSIAQSLFDVETKLSQGNFDAALLAAGPNPDECLELCARIRNNPRLFNLPVMVLSTADHLPDRLAGYKNGASRVFQRPLMPELLVAHVDTLVRRQRLRWRIRKALMRTLDQATRDDRSQAYGETFFVKHLEAHIARAKREQRFLTLVQMRIPSLAGLRREFGDEAADYHFRQLGDWIIGLLRAEDLAARTGTSEFALILPDTPKEEAEVVMNRIAGVISHTDFAVPDVFMPVKAWIDCGLASFTEGDTLKSLIARARSSFD